MEVAAALLDASRKLSEKDVSTGNVSTTSCSSWTSSNNEVRPCSLVKTELESIFSCQRVAPRAQDKPPGSPTPGPAPGRGRGEYLDQTVVCWPPSVRALSETVSSSEKQATMSWLGMFPAGNKQTQDCNTININIPPTKTRTRRVSCKGIETAMAGGLGKVWYDS